MNIEKVREKESDVATGTSDPPATDPSSDLNVSAPVTSAPSAIDQALNAPRAALTATSTSHLVSRLPPTDARSHLQKIFPRNLE